MSENASFAEMVADEMSLIDSDDQDFALPGERLSATPVENAHQIKMAHQAAHALQIRRYHQILEKDSARQQVPIGHRLRQLSAPVSISSIALSKQPAAEVEEKIGEQNFRVFSEMRGNVLYIDRKK